MINNRQNGRRRGRGGGGGGGPRPNGSGSGDRGNRIDNRTRGNANQLYEKYKTLARDMQTQGDRVMTEYYLQFADHYYRVLNESRSRFEDQRRPREETDDYGDDGDSNQVTMEESFDRDRGMTADAPPPREHREHRESREGARDTRDTRESNRDTRDEQSDDGYRQEQRPRRGRPARPVHADAPVRDSRVEDDQIEIDRLPPALAIADVASDDQPVEIKRRRGRPPKVQPAAEG